MNASLPARATAALIAAVVVNPSWGQSQFDEYRAGIPDLGLKNYLMDVSGDGRTILGQSPVPNQPFLIEDGVQQDLPSGGLALPVGLRLSTDGRVVIGTNLDLPRRALVWVNGSGPVALPLPAGAIESFGDALNGDGSILVGRALGSQAGSRAVRWMNSRVEFVAPPVGVPFVSFADVSTDGSRMAGNLDYAPNRPDSRAVRWSAEGGYLMLEFPDDALRTVANAQSDDGRLTAGEYWPMQGGRRAAIWGAAGNMTDLHQAGWFSSRAVGVDAAGTRVLLDVDIPFTNVAYLYDVRLGTIAPLVDVVAQTGGPSLPLEEVARPVAISADGSAAIGSRFGDLLDPDYSLWRARINAFGHKVCGPAQATSLGSRASLLGSGSLSVSNNTAALHATLLPPGEFGLFLASRTLRPMPASSGDGILCLGGAIGCFQGPGQIATSGGAGTLHLGLDLGSIPQPMGSVPGMPGETWYFQAWFRDSNPQPTTNLSDALAATLTP